MPNSERIEQLISPDALKQFDQLKASTDANTASFEKLIAKAVELNKAVGGASTFKELNKATVEMTDNEKALAKQVDELAKANAKLQALYTDEAKKLADVKLQQQARNQAIKEEIQLNQAAEGSIKQKQIQLKQLTKEYDNLSTVERESAKGQELLKSIQDLDKELKKLEGSTGRFQRNVGNYSGALQTLDKALQDVTKKIDDNTKSGQQNTAVIEALQKEQGLLQSLIDTQSKGFANATSEIRNNQQAILLLSQVYGEDSAVVTELTAKTAHLVDTVGDMKATIKAQASDTHVFDGLIGAAQGLVGVYSVAQGAAALFGDENEELQKTFVKLQAVMTVLQGLQGIQNLLQKESAARQLVNLGLQRVALINTNLQTAAESKNIVVRYAAIVAQKALNLAMSAAGGPLLAIIGIIALLVLSLKSFAAQAESTRKTIEQLSAEFDRDLKALQDYNDFVKRNGDEIIAEMESRFATEKDIRKQRTKNLQEQLQAALELEKEYGFQVDQEQAKLVRVLKKNADDRTDKEKEALEKQDELIQKFRDQQKKRQDLAAQVRISESQNRRANTEESIKAQQEEIEIAKTALQTKQQLQQSIASDERKTQSERIAALKESTRIQRQIINSTTNSQLLNPGLTPSQIKLIEAQRTAALTQARRESNKAIEDLNRSYAERERKARFEIIRTEIEDQIKADDLIVQNEKSTFDQRLAALYDGYTRRRDIIIAQHDLDIKNDTLTAEERTAIEKKYISDINGLTIEFGLQQQELYKNNQDAINAIIEKNQQGRIDKLSTQYSNELIALDKSLRDGNISIEQYQRQREEIERQGQIALLKQEVDNQTAKVLATKEGTAERFAAEKELADKTLALNDAVNAKQIAAAQKLADLRKELISSSFDAITSIQDSFFTSQSQAIQRQIDQIDAQKQKDIDAANASVGTAQDKADAVAKIEARAQQKREDLERRQRQIELERARFEKAANIAQIIASTAAAVIEALKTYKGTPQAFAIAATIGTIGAINLAKAIATPLPKFAEGTADASGGLSWVGDAGKKELIITPQGQIVQTPAVPTVMNVPKHSIVLPDARAALESGLAVNKYGQLVQNNAGSDRIEQKLDNIAKVIKNKPVLNMSADQGGLTAIWKYGANWVQYTEDQIKF